MTRNAKKVSLGLSDDERTMLVFGLLDWQGPTRCTEALAIAMGFEGLENLAQEGRRIIASIKAGEPLSRRDWSRALLSTEIVFASEVVGTGLEWTVIQGGTDAYWISVLRNLQKKVPHSHRWLGP